MSDLKPPPFGYDDGKTRLFTATEIARLVAEPAYPADMCVMRLRRMNNAGLVHTTGTRKKPSGKAQNLFGLHDALVAKTLFALSDLGIERKATYQAASLALYGWPPGTAQQKYPHPIIAAAAGAMREEWSSLQLDTMKHPATGQIQIVGTTRLDIRKVGEPSPVVMKLSDEGWMIGASVVLELPPIIMTVLHHHAFTKAMH